MKKWTLYSCSKTGRSIISSYRPKYRVRTIRAIKTTSFAQAKTLFGF